MEVKLAKTTVCRACNQYFVIGASITRQLPRLQGRESSTPPKDTVAPEAASSPGAALPEKSESGNWWSRVVASFLPATGPKAVACFECGTRQEVPRSATSCSCRACGAYLDLQDVKVVGAFSRAVRTAGHIYVTSRGDMNSTRAVCGSAEIRGILRGNLKCLGEMRIKYKGKLPGGIETKILRILKGSDLDFFRPIHAEEVIVEGNMKGRIMATGTVRITKSGSMTGALFARGISIDRGGVFHGEMSIGQQQSEQKELIPTKKREPEPGRENPQPELGFGFS
ncbi:MAG TPA: polymer-forming cytoskeletal protein [Chthoniobacterales bacterium]